jgi:hypothetical protein
MSILNFLNVIDLDIVKNAPKKDPTRIAVLVQSVVDMKVFLGITNYEYWNPIGFMVSFYEAVDFTTCFKMNKS